MRLRKHEKITIAMTYLVVLKSKASHFQLSVSLHHEENFVSTYNIQDNVLRGNVFIFPNEDRQYIKNSK